ncbi:MgtC/SapB family protein [Methanopyrus kandleri]
MDEYLRFLQMLVLSAAVGMVVGLEREHAHIARRVAGFRTFTLIGVLGGLTTHFYTLRCAPIAAVTSMGAAALTVTMYVMRVYQRRSLGIVTPLALLVTFAAGALVGMGKFKEGATLAIATAVVLLSRARIHPVLRKLSDRDVLDALTVFSLAALVYPLCPPGPVDPWGVLNLRTVIEIVLLVLAVTALGYLGVRVSVKGGVLTTSLIGGFVSSSATTATVAARFRDLPWVPAAVIPAATSVAILRNMALVAAVSRDLPVVEKVAYVAIPAAVAGFAVAVYESGRAEVDRDDLRRAVRGRMRSPLSLKPAVKLGLLISGFSMALKVGQLFAGKAGLVVGVVVGSLASSSAMSLSLAYMVNSGTLSSSTAGVLIALSSLESILVKYLWTAVFGKRGVLERTWRTLLPPTIAGIAGFGVVLAG